MTTNAYIKLDGTMYTITIGTRPFGQSRQRILSYSDGILSTYRCKCPYILDNLDVFQVKEFLETKCIQVSHRDGNDQGEWFQREMYVLLFSEIVDPWAYQFNGSRKLVMCRDKVQINEVIAELQKVAVELQKATAELQEIKKCMTSHART